MESKIVKLKNFTELKYFNLNENDIEKYINIPNFVYLNVKLFTLSIYCVNEYNLIIEPEGTRNKKLKKFFSKIQDDNKIADVFDVTSFIFKIELLNYITLIFNFYFNK